MSEVLPVEITRQGAVFVNNMTIHRQSETICALSIDLKTKYASVITYADNFIIMAPPKEGQHTTIVLPQFAGWAIWCIEALRYTVLICMVKK